MPVILALDTSGPFCSVALAKDGQRWTESNRVDRQHNLHILGAIDRICAQGGILPRDLEGIVFVKGPGSFTGVRLCVAVTQALALGAGARVLGITTSLALALHLKRLGHRRGVTAVRSRGLLWYVAGYALDAGTTPTLQYVDQLVGSPPEWLAEYLALAGEQPPWLPAGFTVLPVDENPALTVLEYGAAMFGGPDWIEAGGALPVYIDGDHPWVPAARTEKSG
jgi:tRNA threonylcarbamoyl adenosine modification protein YeaZ